MDLIISPDTERKNRVPPGQRVTRNWPVLHKGSVPKIEPLKWSFNVWGLVEKELELDFDEFMALPWVKVHSDIHCVTRWTILDNLWEGISSRTLVDLVDVLPEAEHVMVHSVDGYTTNLRFDDFLEEDVLFAVKRNQEMIDPVHGGPVRLVVPRLYFWKSAKWAKGIEFIDQEIPGYWEARGYHIRGDPWKEARYSH